MLRDLHIDNVPPISNQLQEVSSVLPLHSPFIILAVMVQSCYCRVVEETVGKHHIRALNAGRVEDLVTKFVCQLERLAKLQLVEFLQVFEFCRLADTSNFGAPNIVVIVVVTSLNLSSTTSVFLMVPAF